MRWFHYLFLPEQQAAELGFTHHGRIFGMPAYLLEAVDDDGDDVVMACPKVVAFQFYTLFMDALFTTVAIVYGFVDPDFELNTPIFIGKRITNV